jgi:hypothetical protein
MKRVVSSQNLSADEQILCTQYIRHLHKHLLCNYIQWPSILETWEITTDIHTFSFQTGDTLWLEIWNCTLGDDEMGEGESDVNRPVYCVDPHILLNDWSFIAFLNHLVLKHHYLISHFKISEIMVSLYIWCLPRIDFEKRYVWLKCKVKLHVCNTSYETVNPTTATKENLKVFLCISIVKTFVTCDSEVPNGSSEYQVVLMLTNTLQGREISLHIWSMLHLETLLKINTQKWDGGVIGVVKHFVYHLSPLLDVATHGCTLILDTKFETPNTK